MRDANSTAERIRDAARIGGYLKLLKEEGIQVSLSLPGQDHFFTAYLETVDLERRLFILSDLAPSQGNALLQDHKRLKLITELRGTRLEFTTSVQKIRSENNNTLFLLAFPSEMEYNQRRLDFRSPTTYAQAVKVTLIDPGLPGPVHARLLDLSLGGLAIETKQAIRLAPGTRIELAQLSFDEDDFAIECSLEIRHCLDMHNGRVKIGARFVGLQLSQQTFIARTVARLQRSMLRQQLKTS